MPSRFSGALAEVNGRDNAMADGSGAGAGSVEALQNSDEPSVTRLLVSGAILAGSQAAAVTFFGFLSFFPILALAFAVAAGWKAWTSEGHAIADRLDNPAG